jgi:hypothetical protein
MVTRITEARFQALAMWCRSPASRSVLADKSFWSAAEEGVIGATYYIADAKRFGYVLLARDKHGRYQAFEEVRPFTSARAADIKIAARLAELEGGSLPEPPMRPDTRPGVDLFTLIEGADLNPKFLNLRDGRNSSAARELLQEIGRWVVDMDGNLVRDFQTTGFDARTWEIYLFAAFKELGFGLDRTAAVPDFRLVRDDTKLFVEAVTANPTGVVQVDIKEPPPPPPEDFQRYLEHDMPQKFGSPLASKLRKAYWEREDVRGCPFLLAIADFHAPASMFWSQSALPRYLYGVGADLRYTPEGQKYGVEKKLREHVVGKKVIPTNFFAQEATRHVSAVLFSNAGTMAKINPMGVLAGFGDPEVTLIRTGGLFDPDPEVFEPVPFEVNIEDPGYEEYWADEICIYHNPNALVPLQAELLPDVAHFHLEDGKNVWWGGRLPRVLFSRTRSLAHSDRQEPG